MSQAELPSGWEKRTDQRTGKTYYVNHVQQKTQWDDPRLDDGPFWSGNNIWRLEALKTLKVLFPSCTEKLLREGLIESQFNTDAVVQALLRSGYEQSQQGYQSVISAQQQRASSEARRASSEATTRVSSPRVATASPAPTASSRRSTNASTPRPTTEPRPTTAPRPMPESQQNPDDDMFTVLYLKSRFSAVTESVIKEVLASCRNNAQTATAMLKSMGFEDETAVESRLEQERAKQQAELRRVADEQRQREQDRDRIVCKLNAEFPLLPNGRVTEVLAACEQNYDKARTELLALENARCLAQEFDMSDDVIYRLLDSANQDVSDVRQQIEQIRLAKQKDDRKESANQLNTSAAQCDPATTATSETSADNDSEIATDRQSIALGANPLLCKGSNPGLLSERCVANGPDPSNCNGPDESLLRRCAQRADMSALIRTQSPFLRTQSPLLRAQSPAIPEIVAS